MTTKSKTYTIKYPTQSTQGIDSKVRHAHYKLLTVCLSLVWWDYYLS